MKKASEYRMHARECRELAAKMMLGEQRDQLIRMAVHWDQLASDRAAMVLKHPEMALPGEPEEEAAAAPPIA